MMQNLEYLISNLTFHPSSLKDLMANGKGVSIGETSKKVFLESYLKYRYGIPKQMVQTWQMDKGNQREQDTIDLLNRSGNYLETLVKNEKTFENDYLIGTPDVICEEMGMIIEIKNSSNFMSFLTTDYEATYNYQCQAYMALTGLKKCRLAITLFDATDDFLHKEVDRFDWAYKNIDMEMHVFHKFLSDLVNYHVFSKKDRENTFNSLCRQFGYPSTEIDFKDCPIEHRIKIINIDFCEDTYKNIKNRIVEGREYLQQQINLGKLKL